MSNVNNTGPLQLGPLDTLLERLNETETKITQLRQSFSQSLSDLEAEQNDIRRQCMNEFRALACAVAAKAQMDQERDGSHVVVQDSSTQYRNYDLQSQEGVQEASGTNRELKRRMVEQDGNERDGKRLKPDHINSSASVHVVENDSRNYSTTPFPNPGTSLSSISGAWESVAASVVDAQSQVQGSGNRGPAHKHENQPPVPRLHRPPRPPINPCPFIEGIKDIDVSSYLPELKCEGLDWFVLVNPSSKVKLKVDLVHTFDGCVVESVKFSRDGMWLATGEFNGVALIYDVRTHDKICVLDHDLCESNDCHCPVHHVCFSPDKKYLAAAVSHSSRPFSFSTFVVVWNICEKKQIVNVQVEIASDLHFSSNGQFIVFCSDTKVGILDVHNGDFEAFVMGYDHGEDYSSSVLSVALSPDDRYVAVGGLDGFMGILDILTGDEVTRFRGYGSSVDSVAFLPNGKGLISGNFNTLQHWDVGELGIGSGTHTASTMLTSPPPCVMNLSSYERTYEIAISHDGTWLASNSGTESVLFWDARTGELQFLLWRKQIVSSIDLSPTENFLAVAGCDYVKIWRYEAVGS